ncbi:DUF5990 family protein [Asticcacaulis benevestitus]|uniref:Uncharacterized protein n=1 Tax=Asticcacaulis benevestitus DSM 16100 = ATCC BAA-896 TaxID=1121022 RepID=V4P9L0_9CAUL|nr:DUF5990 family protein [Asticcacaulis benevestitus]ESQ83774.1 hypothetical protein ABENE_20085 [Asticcacaulis benevestitus DSM 16100 = ATCC BAA-896]
MAESKYVRFRLLRDSSGPPSPDGSPCGFGLQDTKGVVYAGIRRADDMIVFEFELMVTDDPVNGLPIFNGGFASGSKAERLVYLSWPRLNGAGYVNRVKVRLADAGWPLIRAAQAQGKVLEADTSGRASGGGQVPVSWRLAEP